MTTGEFIVLLIILAIYFGYKKIVDIQYENSPRRDLSIGKLALYEGSKTQLKKDIMAGKLDKDEHFRI